METRFAAWGAMALAVALGGSAPAQPVPSPEEEFRAAWVTRFEWPASTEAQTRQNITNIMETLADANFNAVLFQIRGQCDVLYPSPYEPWGRPFNWTDPGWDPLQFAIDEARANGLEFHAYINTHTLMQNTPPAQTEPQHRYNLHNAQSDDPWVIHDTNGNPVDYISSYSWISPGHPDAEAWTRKMINHVVDNYDVDGLHFDRIRTPGAGYSYDPRSIERFEGDGNPDAEEWGDFMRAQITRQLRRIYGATMLRNPDIKISAAPFGIVKRVEGGYQGTGTQSYYSWYQDSWGWMESGVLDFLVPMIYWDIGSAHPFEVLLADFLARDGGRHIVAGSITSRDYIEQVYETRRQEAPGQVIFSYGSANWQLYKNGPYAEPADLPAMPWKEAPQHALVAGTVTDSQGEPVLDVRINRDGDDYNYLTGADGFYTILNIPPGTWTISAEKADVGTAQAVVELEAGDIHELNLTLLEDAVTIAFDRDAYYVDDEGTLTVVDEEVESAVDTVTAALSNLTQDTQQEVTLSRVSPESFEGTFTLSSSDEDGALEVAPGDSIRALYDWDEGTATANAEIEEHIRVYHEPVAALPADMQMDAGWEGGEPQGTSGTAGAPGPAAPFTGNYILGYNLAGGYETDLPEERWLTTPPVDLSQGHNTHLRFQRWLQAGPADDHGARIEVSHDGEKWFPVWNNPEGGTGDSEWTQMDHDVARWMDGRTAVQFRWAMGPVDAPDSYAGWHLDNIEVRQLPGRQIDWILDNDEPGFEVTGDNWDLSLWGANFGPDKRYTEQGDGTTEARWTFSHAPPGLYHLRFWVNSSSYASGAHYTVYHDGAGEAGETVTVSQHHVGDGWHDIGTFAFTSGEIYVTLSDQFDGPGGFVIADALRVTKEEPLDPPELAVDGWLLF